MKVMLAIPVNQGQELSLLGYTPGVYFCTLVVNGTAVQTNRMLVQ